MEACAFSLMVSGFKQSYDGNSDHRPLRGVLKKPPIPPRMSSLRAFNRSRSSGNLKAQIKIEETPSPRRASSISLPPTASRSPSIPPTVLEGHTGVQNVTPTSTQDSHMKVQTPKLITPLPTPYVAPQTSLQPTIATPVLIIPGNENPFDLATTLEDGRFRRVSTGSIDPFVEEEEDEHQSSAKGPAKNLPGTSIDGREQPEHPHVGWRFDLLTVAPGESIEDAPEGYSRRRSSSLPDLPGAGGGRSFKSVKGRRATPWVHNIGINGTTAGKGKGKRVKLAFPTLKRLSDASVKSIESGHEVWFDALEEQEED
ncbi:hypothetical protein TWF281_001083 [Arthrobotrys megalospora]